MEVEPLARSCFSRATAGCSRSFFAALAASLAVLVLAGTSHASMMLPMTVEELTEDADLVAVGRVVHKESKLSAGGGRIFTVVTIDVSEAWKGATSKQVEIHVPGGTVDGISQVVVGVPQFTVGEDAVVFLKGLAPATAAKPDEAAKPQEPDASVGERAVLSSVQARLVGMAQGKLEVRVDPQGEPLAAPNLSGLELFDPKANQLAPAPLPEPVPLSTLKARVQAADK